MNRNGKRIEFMYAHNYGRIIEKNMIKECAILKL